jgi:hypothetical protein
VEHFEQSMVGVPYFLQRGIPWDIQYLIVILESHIHFSGTIEFLFAGTWSNNMDTWMFLTFIIGWIRPNKFPAFDQNA